MANWSWPREEAQTISDKEDLDLECPPPLEPHLQQLLGEREPSQWAMRWEMASHPCQHQYHPPLSPHENPEPSPLCVSEWIEWHARYVWTLPWWEELKNIPCHTDYKEFAWKMHVSFKVPKACNWVKKVKLPCPATSTPSFGKHHFLSPRDLRFSTQDIHLTQLQHTIAYARALQHWAEEVYPPVPGQPCHLARSVHDLQWAMELLITFADGDVFVTMVPSKWTEITLPQLMKAIPQESPKSNAQSSRAHQRGSQSATHTKVWPAATAMQATAKAGAPTTPPQEFMPHQSISDSQPLCLPPRSAEIAQTLRREEPMESDPLPVITGIPSEEAIDPY